MALRVTTVRPVAVVVAPLLKRLLLLSHCIRACSGALDFAIASCERLAACVPFTNRCVGGDALPPSCALAIARDTCARSSIHPDDLNPSATDPHSRRPVCRCAVAHRSWKAWERDGDVASLPRPEPALCGVIDSMTRGETRHAAHLRAKFGARQNEFAADVDAYLAAADAREVRCAAGHAMARVSLPSGHVVNVTAPGCSVCRAHDFDDEFDERYAHYFACAHCGYNLCSECALAPRLSHPLAMERVRAQIRDLVRNLRLQIEDLCADARVDPAAVRVVPIALSDADLQPPSLFGAGRFGNDHQGELSYACVADRWVVLVCVKVSSC